MATLAMIFSGCGRAGAAQSARGIAQAVTAGCVNTDVTVAGYWPKRQAQQPAFPAAALANNSLRY